MASVLHRILVFEEGIQVGREHAQIISAKPRPKKTVDELRTLTEVFDKGHNEILK